eukprot:11659295-Heterocapsa_arctica.AAC.1
MRLPLGLVFPSCALPACDASPRGERPAPCQDPSSLCSLALPASDASPGGERRVVSCPDPPAERP